MTSGRTVEETVLLALVVYPSPRKRVPSGLGLACYQATSTARRARHIIIIIHIRLQVLCHPCPIWPSVLPLNLTYFNISLETVMSEPALYGVLTFHVPNLIFIFLCLGRLSKESAQVRGPV
jgi:hypothetical protein